MFQGKAMVKNLLGLTLMKVITLLWLGGDEIQGRVLTVCTSGTVFLLCDCYCCYFVFVQVSHF